MRSALGNSLKSLEVSEEKANQRVEEFKRQLKTLTGKLKQAEDRAEQAEKTVKKLQKEVDRLEGTFSHNFLGIASHNPDVDVKRSRQGALFSVSYDFLIFLINYALFIS